MLSLVNNNRLSRQRGFRANDDQYGSHVGQEYFLAIVSVSQKTPLLSGTSICSHLSVTTALLSQLTSSRSCTRIDLVCAGLG